MRALYLAAVVQLNSTSDEDANWRQIEPLVREAAAAGARFIATPENATFLGLHEEKVRRAEPLDGPTCRRFASLAEALDVWLLLGSFPEAGEERDRCFNTSVLFAPDGSLRAAYRKIHLFDADLADDVRFRESDTVLPGREVVVAPTELGAIGMSICYDLRFAEQYAGMRRCGAEVITIPSAFTATTGRDHWHTLVRARAIETQCYVVAAAQQGTHDDEGLRESYGHSLIVDPWGDILAEVDDGPGIGMARIDLHRVREVRRSMPADSYYVAE